MGLYKPGSVEIDGTMLRAMTDELYSIQKTAQPTVPGAAARRRVVPPTRAATEVAPTVPIKSGVVTKVPGRVTGVARAATDASWHLPMPEMGRSGRLGSKVVAGLNRLPGGLGTKLHNVAGERALAQGVTHGAGVKGLQTIGRAGAVGGALGLGALGYGAYRALRKRPVAAQ
jgi:hypothetical protein